MPLNEAQGFKRNNLTKEQKRQAEAVIFGRKEKPMASGQPLSNEEIEHMRQIVAQHDAQGHTRIQEFDLNKPPVKPYVHQEFPRMMYRKGITRIAQDAEELEAALAAGWSTEPPVPEWAGKQEEPAAGIAEEAETGDAGEKPQSKRKR